MSGIHLAETFQNVPPAPKQRLALHVTPAAERALKEGHPWLFESAITKQSHPGEPGSIAVIFDRKDRFLAAGLYDPHSEIRVKVLQHHTPSAIGRAWLQDRLQAAVNLRAPLAKSGHTNGYRLVYGENDGLAGIIIDRYAETLVVKAYTAAWIPHLLPLLEALLVVQPAERIVIRWSRGAVGVPPALADGSVIYGAPLTGDVVFQENGLRFGADVAHGHKTGFFFDHRDNRQRVSTLTKGAHVLDVFAYSGGFSVYAAQGGAKSVMSVDVSAPALETAQQNFALNPQLAGVTHDIRVGDAFEILEQFQHQRQQFDVVVIDPPSFAKRQAEVDRALYAYGRLARLGGSLVRSGGWLVMASCSSRVSAEAFFRMVERESGRGLLEITHTAHALDHPVRFAEGAYLKCLFAKVG
ncbi:MAG: class I SAM-dependent rRNA methyltransferase [Phototrophicaceae bacterium]